MSHTRLFTEQNSHSIRKEWIVPFLTLKDLANLISVAKLWKEICQLELNKPIPTMEYFPGHKLESEASSLHPLIQGIRILGLSMDSHRFTHTSQRLRIELTVTPHESTVQKWNLAIKDTIFYRREAIATSLYVIDTTKTDFFSIRSIELSQSGHCSIWLENDNYHKLTLTRKRKSLHFHPQEVIFSDLMKHKKYDEALISVAEIKAPNEIDNKGFPLLARAASVGQIKIAEALLDKKASIEQRTTYKEGSLTPLLVAAFNKQWEMVRFLINCGGYINAQSFSGKTLLHYIANEGGVEDSFLSFLLESKANPCITDLYDYRPVDLEFSTKSKEKSDLARKFQSTLFRHTMSQDARNVVSHYYFLSESNHCIIIFKETVSSADKIWAWEAIVNKIKSYSVNKEIGLASNDTPCEYAGRGGQVADVEIPVSSEYAIESIFSNGEKNGSNINTITIKIKPQFFNTSAIKEVINTIFEELGLTLGVSSSDRLIRG